MKIFSWLAITVFIIFTASALALTADNSRIAWSNADWGNTDWTHTEWRNTGWSNTSWGNTEWGNTGWGNSAENSKGRTSYDQQTKVTLGIKKPGGSCMVVVVWENSNEEAINSFAKNCQDCTITNLANSVESAESFCQ